MAAARLKHARPIDEALSIESIDGEAQGVAHHAGKVVFVRGALPGERVRAAVVRSKPRFEVAELVAIERGSVLRVAPRCPHFGVCGGCALQHLEPRAQVAIKQRVLEDTLWHVGRVRPATVLRAVAGPSWGYRFRARLSVRHVAKKGGVLVGFHERGSSYVADMTQCPVLPEHVSRLLLPLRELIAGLSIRDRAPQIELAVGERSDGALSTALVLRHLAAPTDGDRAALASFGREHGIEWWLQSAGPDSATLLDPAAGSTLEYCLPEFGVTMPFRPTDFTQVNHMANSALVGLALRLLEPQPGERVVDLFCGLGNFSLPLATIAARVLGVEGSATLVARARTNAQRNGLGDRCEFRAADLFQVDAASWGALGRIDRLLIDPPREGALAIVRAIAAASAAATAGASGGAAAAPAARPEVPAGKTDHPGSVPARIVYVSCNPATLARDCAVLVRDAGYTLRAAGIVNMFPHTTHVESIAVLDLA